MKIFSNSIPKCGSYLLIKAIRKIAELEEAGAIQHLNDRVLNIQDMADNKLLYGHQQNDEAVFEALSNNDFRMLIIVRDPRDMAISKYYYERQVPVFNRHKLFNTIGLNEGLKHMLNNVQPGVRGTSFQRYDLGQWYESFSQYWRNDNVLTVRFEDLVGSKGQGSDEAQIKTLKNIAKFLDLEKPIEPIAKILFGSSRTFRKGTIGQWRKVMSKENQKLALDLAGNAIEELGYSVK